MKSRLKIFVPAHITGFFEIIDHEDYRFKGSKGAGIALDKGVRTETIVKEGNGHIKISLNDKISPLNSISQTTIDIIKKRYCLDFSNYDIVIKHSTDLPISAGFGTSAGFALGISYTLPFLFNVNITHNEAGEIAHIAEVSESTGLGDVISEINGGCVIRLKEGSPIHARIDKIPITKPIYVIAKTISSIDTGNIIKNPLHKKRINDSGHNLLNEILKNPCINNFIKLSYKFSRETKLINKEVDEIVQILNEETIGASMAMLGNTAFALSHTPETSIDDCIITKINTKGLEYKN